MGAIVTRWLWLFVIPLLWSSAPEAQPTRFIYVTPVDGAGTDADPYHSRCMGMDGYGHIDLRTWGIDRFLCASNILPADMTGVAELGSAKNERMTGPRKAVLAALAKKGIVADTVDEAIIELLSSKLRAGKDGKVKIWLGEREPLYQQTAWVPFRDHGYVADAWNALQPAVAWATTLATETFNCADSASLTCVHTWTEFNGTAWAIASNQASASGSTTAEARIDSDLATDDMEVQATLTAIASASETRCGVIGRKDSSTTRTYMTVHTAYGTTAGTREWRLGKRVTGASTTLGTNTTDPATNDIMKLRDDGSSHSAYVNGVEFVAPVTDADVSGNTRAGLMFIGAHASDSCSLDPVDAYDYPLPVSGNAAARRRVS